METFKTGLKIFFLMTFLTGGIYPMLVTAMGQILMPKNSNGSLIYKEGQIVGSEWIGQNFSGSRYFWSRPSATDYNALPSQGTNLALTSQELQVKVLERSQKYQDANQTIPSDLLFASASGLDPHISPEAAQFQIPRIINARQLLPHEQEKLIKLINDFEEKSKYNPFAQKQINVLKLNMALDQNF